MASQVPPKRNTAFDLGLTLYKNDGTLIANPTSLIPKISKDFGNYAAISSVSVEDTTYGQVKAALTATEMDADVVMVYVTDAASGTVPFTATLYTAANLLDGVKIETSSIYAAANSLVAHVSPAVSSIYGGMATAAGLTVVDDFLDTEVSSILGNVVAIKAKTDIIPSSPAPLGGAMTLTDAAWLNMGVVASGTAQSATATTLVLAAASAFADDELNGAVVVITGGTGVGQSRVITDYDSATDTATVDAWTTTPSGTITYVVFAAAPASATSLPAVNLTQIAGSAVATGTAQLGVNVVSVANDAITAAAMAADVATELQSGLATAATVNSLTAYVSPGISSIYSALPSAPSVASLVWQEALASHGDTGTVGEALAAAGSAGDPWSTALPGSYGAGTAGLLVGTNLTTPISSVSTDVPAVLARVNSIVAHVSPGISSIYNALDVEIASIKGDTAAVLARANSLVAHVSPGISSIYGGMATAAALTIVDDFLDTEISSLLGYATAIQAKTAIIPASPAALGDAMTLATGAITAAVIAQNAIDADALAADVATELQSGLATGAALSSVTAYVTPAISSIYSGMATATALASVDDFLDTEISSLLGYSAAIVAKTDVIPSSPAALGDAMALTAAAVDAVLDDPVEGAFTLRQAMRLVLAATAGKVSGAGTNSITIRDINDTVDRITAEVDASGNRATVTKTVN